MKYSKFGLAALTAWFCIGVVQADTKGWMRQLHISERNVAAAIKSSDDLAVAKESVALSKLVGLSTDLPRDLIQCVSAAQNLYNLTLDYKKARQSGSTESMQRSIQEFSRYVEPCERRTGISQARHVR